jgi:hypothetical protein
MAATATIIGAANNSGRRVAVVPTGDGNRYAAPTSAADSSAPQRTTGRRQHNPAAARQTSRLNRACFPAKVWYPPLPNAKLTAMVGTMALIASLTPSRRLPDRKSAPPATPMNKPATGLASGASTDSPILRRQRPDMRAHSAPSARARPSAKVVRVTTRLPARQTAPMTAPATGRGTAARFNNAPNSTTLAT